MIEIISAISSLLDKFIPNKNEAARHQMAKEIFELTQQHELAKGQLEINKNEANHASLFVAGWRPCIGWIGAIALGWQYIILPLLTFLFTALGHPIPNMPELASPEVMNLVMMLLGLGAYRTYEKTRR